MLRTQRGRVTCITTEGTLLWVIFFFKSADNNISIVIVAVVYALAYASLELPLTSLFSVGSIAIALVSIMVIIVMSIHVINVNAVALVINIILFLLFPHYPRYRHYYYYHQCCRPRVIVIEVIAIDLRYRFHSLVFEAITIDAISIFVPALTVVWDV